MSRPSAVVYIATSLDGFIARPDGGLDWLERVQLEGEDYGYRAHMESVDTVVFGRATFDVVLGFGGPWPYVGKRVVVLSRGPARASVHGETYASGPLPALLDRLGAEGAQRVYVDGGQAITSFLAEGLVDELTLSVVPVVLGRGLRLFGELDEVPLALVDSRSYASGLVQLRYRVAR